MLSPSYSSSEKAARVVEILRAAAPVLVAYSGGVDSTVLLALAAELPPGSACGILADSPSLPRSALRAALDEAKRIGIPVRVLVTTELDNPDYASNPPNRCYFCKAELFQKMEATAAESGFASLAYGENADDPPAERPGSRAAMEFRVLAPLRDAGLHKAEIRELARARGLRAAESPASPCLSSRIPYGIPVTREALSRIENGEEILRAAGFRILRVRHLVDARGPVALVQVAPAELPRLTALEPQIIPALLAAGFAAVEIDPLGYRGRVD
jgi:uncharacterized protein